MQTRTGWWVVIHADENFTGPLYTRGTSFPDEQGLFSSTQRWCDLNARSATYSYTVARRNIPSA